MYLQIPNKIIFILRWASVPVPKLSMETILLTSGFRLFEYEDAFLTEKKNFADPHILILVLQGSVN